MKYITRITALGPELVTFAGFIGHDQMAAQLGWPRATLRSAGFISLTPNGLECHGHSASLGLHSLVGDSALANAYFKL